MSDVAGGGTVVAVGGTAWRNRPLASLESSRIRDLAPAAVVVVESGDLEGWLPVVWTDLTIHRVETRYDIPPGSMPDVALLHYPFADESGGVYTRHADPSAWFTDLLLATAPRVIVTFDELLTTAQSRRASGVRRLGRSVELVHAPYGAFPGACDGLYREDRDAQEVFTARIGDGPVPGDRLAALTTPTHLAAASLPHGLEWPGR